MVLTSSLELPEGSYLARVVKNPLKMVLFLMPIYLQKEVFSAPTIQWCMVLYTVQNPLIYHGKTISDFSFTFKEGKIVEYTAKKVMKLLKELVETDEGSHYLGEVALVDHFSPISPI